jgi:toxin-antitoxin system PIN domain toxin
VLSGTEEVGLATPALFGFVRIATNPRLFSPPLAVADAIERVNGWLVRPNVRVLVPGPRHLEIAFDLLRTLGAAANLTTDAQLAASAIENHATLCSNDTDFARFGGLSWVDPLARPQR